MPTSSGVEKLGFEEFACPYPVEKPPVGLAGHF